jgi:hypothetical protein
LKEEKMNNQQAKSDGPDWSVMAAAAVNIHDWLIVCPARTFKIVQRFVSIAIKAGNRIGVKLEAPRIVSLSDDSPDAYYNEIKSEMITYNHVSSLFFVSFFFLLYYPNSNTKLDANGDGRIQYVE